MKAASAILPGRLEFILLMALCVLCNGCRPTKVPGESSDKPQLPQSPLSSSELADGWLSLFDGKTLFGWQPQSEANWRVEKGAIVVDSGEKGLLCTTTQFDDYVLKLEFKGDEETNSGVFLRTAKQVGPDDVTTKCYELNIAPSDNPYPTGSLVGRQKVSVTCESNQWHDYEIKLDGPNVTIKLDGKEILAYEDPQPISRGWIGLQLNQGPIAFRNIKIQPLGLKSIFNGNDLAGWTEYPKMESKFTVTSEGELNVKNGRGQLETEEYYGDFVFQLECISNAKGLNSGIFFRCIPGEQMNGYESQIQNEFKDNDPAKPTDYGTGGIFRQQPARFVMAADLDWFYKTIIADGPHVAVWVNGVQVSDWTDTRQRHENPREGLRLEAGTIMIQGHDPTTDLSFRNLKIREMNDQP